MASRVDVARRGLHVLGYLVCLAAHAAEGDDPFRALARTMEPGLNGCPERLAEYIHRFQAATFADSRVYAFRVVASCLETGTIALHGHVEFEEMRAALVRCLRLLGFDKLDDRIEVLPSAQLGADRFGIIQYEHAWSRLDPDEEAEVVNDTLLGEPVFLLTRTDNGYYLCHSGEGYLGYIPEAAIKRCNVEGLSRYLRADAIRMRFEYVLPDSKPRFAVPCGARLEFVEKKGDHLVVRLPAGPFVSVPESSCTAFSNAVDPRTERVLENAIALVGTPYRWGGKTSAGVDCSGLVQVAFAAEGIHLPRDSNQQVYVGQLAAARWCPELLRRGDALYFMGSRGRVSHTALYLGDGQYLEAVTPRVTVSSFNPRDANFNASGLSSFAFAKRLLD